MSSTSIKRKKWESSRGRNVRLDPRTEHFRGSYTADGGRSWPAATPVDGQPITQTNRTPAAIPLPARNAPDEWRKAS